MLRAIAHQPGEWSEVKPVGNKVQCLHSWGGPPQIGIDPAGVNQREDGSETRRLAVHQHFNLAVAAAAAGARPPGRAFVSATHGEGHGLLDVFVWQAGVPELVVELALRELVQVDTLRVARESDLARELVSAGLQV